MRRNPNQLEFEFEPRGVAISTRYACEHQFRTDEFTDHEVCQTCGLCVPHEYILDNLDIKEWAQDEL
jgi:predicted transcriptional regulator